jgi:peptidyl-prolyl cis-trans isomerase C
MKKVIFVLLAAILLSGCGESIVGEVNGRKISEQEFNRYLKFKRVARQDEKQVKTQLQDYLQREALADVIEDSDLIDREMLEIELNEFRKQMLISRYFEQYLNDTVSEEAVKNYFNTHSAEFEHEKIKVSHILIRTHEGMSDAERQARLTKAQEAYSKAQTGKEFADIAAQYSEDTVSAKQGGDLGWLRRGAIDPVFSERIFTMKAGEISEPFATPFGFHVVKVLEDPQSFSAEYEKVKGDIRYRLRQEAKQAEMDRLLGEVRIEQK